MNASSVQTEAHVMQESNITNFEVKIEKKKLKFSEDTIDNENMGKKKSKICCIYSKPNKDPSEGDCDSSCDSDEGNAYDAFPKHQKHAMKKKKQQQEGSNVV